MKLILKNNKILEIIKLFRRAFGGHKWQIISMAILSFISGILETIGINAVIPLFSFISGGKTTDIISQSIEKLYQYFHITYTVKYVLIFIILLFLIKAIILFFTQNIIVRMTSDYEQKMRSELLKLTFVANWPYLSKQKIGHLDQILTTNITNSSSLLFYIGSMIIVITNMIVYGFLAINISFVIAMLAFILGFIVFLIFKPLFYKNRVASEEIAQKYKQLAHYVNESVIGMKTIKSMLIDEQVLKTGLTYFERMKNLQIRIGMFKILTNVILQPLSLMFIVGIFAFFYKTSALNFASFAVIVYAINKVFANIQMVQVQVHVINSQIPHLMSVLNYKEDILRFTEKDTGTSKFLFNDQLTFQNVYFIYNEDGKKDVLSDVNFNIKKGSIIGLIGPSGAGKTTIVDLLLRLFNPQKGRILLDGADISNINLKDWRRNIRYVSQDIFLMNDTIENNIKFYNESITHEDVVRAAKMANIHDFIESQPDRYKTIAGERGMRLSGGQRQRIVLARALVGKPQILILDEATSALDNESEALIQKSIESLRGKMTVIVIAHRLTTVMISDKLIVLEDGKIVEEGESHELLKDKDSHFFKMYNVRK